MSVENKKATSNVAGKSNSGTAARIVGSTGVSIPQLRATVKGRVIAPGDAGYDEARTVFYGGIDRRPAVIVRVADATDVAHVVSLARETGLELAVRSGGHSVAGHSVSEGGIVLDLSDMKALDIDAERRTAWAETGLTAGEYTTAAGAYGLATGFGDTGSVGIGGITLGGGVGYLVRKYGLTIDNLLAAEIVTADGQLLPRGRRDAPGPVLGDPRRRRQLRRRDPVPVPAARGRHDRGRHADAAGDARGDRLVHRRGRGRAGGAVDHRQRHARAADAVRAGGASRQARRHGAAGLRR